MDGKLARVIELANQLRSAVLECDCAVSVYIDGDAKNQENTGVHIWKPENEGLEGLEFYRQDEDGARWFKSRAYGVNVFGTVRGGEEE